MSHPLISVIVPVYNVEAYLKECVNSIRNQTYQKLEILLIDDGSPDHSGQLCDLLAQEDSRIRVIHKENGGLSSARNTGIEAATGEYLSFVDSDDWIDPQMYERLYHLIETHGAQVAAGGLQTSLGYHFNPAYPTCAEIELFSRTDALREVTRNQKITNSVCDKLWKKSLFDTVRFPEGEYFEDIKTSYKCLEKADIIAYDPRPAYIYRMTEDSISRGQFHPRMFEDAYAAKTRAEYYKEKYPDLYPYALAEHIRISLIRIWQSRKAPSCQLQRKALIQQMQQHLPAEAVQCLSKNGRIKLSALRLGTPVFHLIMQLHECIRK